ncbi:SMI1/KNR4 family protein [Ktedonobacteria bacterium brp13]|nr:SMI1/KNR4 family protein [Ktedonobacteria bacterium brp13]
MDSVQMLWRRIENWMSNDAPFTWQKLPSGASEEEIQQAEEVLGMTLPQDFKTSYRMHNGHFCIDLVTTMDILPLQKAIEYWKELKLLLEDGVFDDNKPYYFFDPICIQSHWQTGPIQPVWWHVQWIPFGIDRAGNFCCLDLVPASGGSVGQIIDWDHECGPSRTLFSNFQQLLSTFADQVEAGYYVDTVRGLRVRSEVDENEL